MKIEFTQPDFFDASECAQHLNADDRRELLAIGVEPEWGIHHSIAISPSCMCVKVDDKVACLVGLATEDSLGDSEPRPWLFGTQLLFSNPRVFVSATRRVLDFWLSEFESISNFVDCRNLRAIGWLRHFGAEFSEPQPFGPYNRPFLKFTFRRS